MEPAGSLGSPMTEAQFVEALTSAGFTVGEVETDLGEMAWEHGARASIDGCGCTVRLEVGDRGVWMALIDDDALELHADTYDGATASELAAAFRASRN